MTATRALSIPRNASRVCTVPITLVSKDANGCTIACAHQRLRSQMKHDFGARYTNELGKP